MWWTFQQVLAACKFASSFVQWHDQTQIPWENTEALPKHLISFNWSRIRPAVKLKWHPCYERHECARLQVPMDWAELSSHETVAVAVIRQPVSIPRSDSRYGGSIILNPGGPGGSGVEFLRWSGYELQSQVTGSKHFDLVSFDPRGVEHTTPAIDCFTNNLNRQAFYLVQNAAGPIDDIERSLRLRLASAEAFSQACNSTIVKHMTTYCTAQDIVAIADALQPTVSNPLINYWGISYGTILGNVLASAFPHRIGKFVLDGVVDIDAYLKGMWVDNLADAPSVLDHFHHLCHKVGPDKCALWDSTSAKIRAKVDNVLQSLKTSPIPMPRDTGADVLTSSDVQSAIFRALYFPTLSFPMLAEAIHDLQDAPVDTALIAKMVPARITHGRRNTNPISPTNRSTDNPFPTSSSSQQDAQRIIACTDARLLDDWNWSKVKDYINDLSSVFPLATNIWASLTLGCVNWSPRNRPPGHARFLGPFATNWNQYDVKRGARPIMWVGNKADPVTPLKHARAMAARHEKSRILETGIYGHATGPVNANQCVYSHIRDYFTYGILPRNGSFCEEEAWEWDLEARTIPRFWI